MSGEPLDQLINTVDPGACRLIKLPDKIWVFGGPFEDDSNKPAQSLRNSFCRQAFLHSAPPHWFEHIKRPEDYPDWWFFSGYGDLLEFERDACYLAHAIILFAESPGSYAELGALALDKWILPHLFVIVRSEHLLERKRQSFLNLGPLTRVEMASGRCDVSATSNDLLETDFEATIESISAWLPKKHNSLILDINNPMHRLLLLADLTDLLLVSKLDDLQLAMDHFGVKINETETKKSLQLLDFFGLVKIERLGNTEFFYVRRRSSSAPWINYAAKEGDGTNRNRFDRSRFKVASEKHVQSDKRKKSIFERPQ